MKIAHFPATLAACLLLARAATAAPVPADAGPLVLRDGDRIAFVGNAFVEREQDDCYLETLLVTRFPHANIVFRNLGWSGDTVTGEARAMFGTPREGFDRLKKEIDDLKPNVVLVSYGLSESFGGDAKLPQFLADLRKMLDMLAAHGATGDRMVLISPVRHEDLGKPWPDPAGHNRQLKLYVDAMQKLAAERRNRFVDLYGGLPQHGLTDDGIHLTPYGYWRAALAIEAAMGYGPRRWQVEIDARDQKGSSAQGTKITEVTAHADGVTFTAADETLPAPPAPRHDHANAEDPPANRILRVSGLPAPAGKYALKAASQVLATAAAGDWDKGVDIPPGAAADQVEKLRRVVIAKNEDFFNHWRPENDTYLFGFRKHEQGKNAAEIPQFEPLVSAKELEIARLRVPSPVTYTLVKAD